MLPTCIGISGVSRYRNDASIDDSFLASLILSSRELHAAPWQRFWRSGLWPGLCIFRRRICNGKRPRAVKLPELALRLGQTIRQRPQGSRVHAQSDMTGQIYLDIFGGIGGTQEAGSP